MLNMVVVLGAFIKIIDQMRIRSEVLKGKDETN